MDAGEDGEEVDPSEYRGVPISEFVAEVGGVVLAREPEPSSSFSDPLPR